MMSLRGIARFRCVRFSIGRFALQLEALQAPLLLHAHRHQKTFDAVNPILDMLRLNRSQLYRRVELNGQRVRHLK
jgi:hypothetical protein